MSGKRAKPSPWRFVRLVPVLLVSMVVCAMLGLFLLFQDPGDDQAHEWGLDPVPSSSHDEEEGDQEPSPADSSSPSTSTRATPPGQPAPVVRRDASPVGNQSPEPPAPAPTARRERTQASVPASPPVHRPTRPPAPETTVPPTGPPKDNPGKKKGHRKHHARQGDQG